MRTSQLEEKLGMAGEFDEALIRENGCPDLCTVISSLMHKKGMTRAELIKKMNIDRNYGYQLLNGTRMPTRNHLIQIGLLLELEVDELQQILKIADKKPLYVRDMFDARVFYAIRHKFSFAQAVEFIWD